MTLQKLFWRSGQDTTLSTCILISSTPRLRVLGFSLAPCRSTPPILTATSNNDQSYHLAFDGAESEYRDIIAKGFSAFWLIYEFNGGRRKRLNFSACNPKKTLDIRLNQHSTSLYSVSAKVSKWSDIEADFQSYF